MFRVLKPFQKGESGVAAIEFAMFAVPFFLMILGILELGMMYGTYAVLNGGSGQAARLIRTGAIQGNDATTQTEFETALCNELSPFIRCPNENLTFSITELQGSDNFSTAYNDPSSIPSAVDSSDQSLSPRSINSGGPGSKIIVRVAYDFQFMTPFAAPFFSDRPGNKKLLTATFPIQNEPYGGSDG